MHGTLYIHTGMPKTGSTSIQMTCFKNRELLLRRGYYYADFHWNHVWALEAAYRTAPERPIIFHDSRYTQPFDPSTLSDVRGRLESTLADHSDRNCILSGETVVYWNHDHFRKLKEGIATRFDRVKVVVYVRHPTLWANSMAQHAVRLHRLSLGHVTENLPSRRAKLVPGFRRIQTAIDMFGRDNVEVRTFDRARFVGGELLHDFLDAVEAPVETRAGVVTTHKNTGASALEIGLIDNLVTRRPDIDKAMLKNFKAKVRGLPGTKFVLPRETLATIWEASHPERSYLTKILGYDPFPDPALPEIDVPLMWTTETLAHLSSIAGADVHHLVGDGGLVTSRDLERICDRLTAILVH